ncbi:MAG: bifunctional UDP-sugar hydrolase/5'-nucleotidase [Pseudomonadota bacterium]
MAVDDLPWQRSRLLSYARWTCSQRVARLRGALGLAALLMAGPVAAPATPAEANADAHADRQETTVTLLFTNDLESAYDPIPAYWREDLETIGGFPQLATLIEQVRAAEPNVFLFDAGDIFTGTLARETRGEVSFELMLTMGYDAMVIGNHEFEYGWEVFARQKQRVPFPVLGANLRYRDSGRPYARPSVILERNGVRIGVIGVLGQDAATALIPSNSAGLVVEDPVPVVRQLVGKLRQQVDLIVVLTHQGMTEPMQTNDEADPRVQRGNAENLALAGAVPGIDVIFAGHTDAGTREPLVHPETSTLIMQTFGQGQHLGYLQLALDLRTGRRLSHSGRLLEVDGTGLDPHPRVAAKLTAYRSRFPELYRVLGQSQAYLSRRYYEESDLGNLFADIVRQTTATQIGLMPSGALRKDLPRGAVRRVDLLDAFPFEDRLARVTVTGTLLREIIEQGLTLERGLLQVSGLRVTFDPGRPAGQRVLAVTVGEEPLDDQRRYTVGTLEILSEGGDAYDQFRRAEDRTLLERTFAAALEGFVIEASPLQRPAAERYQTLSEADRPAERR